MGLATGILSFAVMYMMCGESLGLFGDVMVCNNDKRKQHGIRRRSSCIDAIEVLTATNLIVAIIAMAATSLPLLPPNFKPSPYILLTPLISSKRSITSSKSLQSINLNLSAFVSSGTTFALTP